MSIKYLLAAMALLAAACSPLSASPRVQMEIVDREGARSLPQYFHRGDSWVPGAPGHRYAVRLTNNSGGRVLVVLSIDGINAVTGETADPAQSGYVLDAWQSTEVAGWRKSMDDIAQFVFTDLGDSYAARTGRPKNVGVIGIAVFDEARNNASRSPAAINREAAPRAKAQSAESAAHAGSTSDAMATQSLGTGHGAREWSRVSRTHFERASARPSQMLEIRYDDRPRLVSRGIIPASRHPANGWAARPKAFPHGFVPDP